MDSSTADVDGENSSESTEKVREEEATSWTEQAVPAASQVPAVIGSDQAPEPTDSAPSSSPTLAIDSSAPLQGSEHRKGLLDVATEYINDNIKIFRRLPWIIGGVGVVLLIRFYPRMAFRRYRHPSDIPRQLFENNIQLTGVVAMTRWDSVGVWHVPVWRRVLRWQHQPHGVYSEDELLDVKFAGVAIGSPENSEKWLESTLLGKRVWFTLLDHTPNKNSLSSVVYVKHKGWLAFGRKWCVNEQLLANGLGSLDEVRGFKKSKEYTNFIHRLGQRETTAKRTGAGMWKGSEYVSWWRRLARMLRLSS